MVARRDGMVIAQFPDRNYGRGDRI